jgi:hypothetical protein
VLQRVAGVQHVTGHPTDVFPLAFSSGFPLSFCLVTSIFVPC